MKYLLAFNVACKLYKNYPTIQLFCDDHLIDEFSLDKRYEKDDVELNIDKEKYGEILKPGVSTTCILPNRVIHQYIINSDVLTDKIFFRIKNSDSNYTNGFMTKSTCLAFGFIVLIPLDFLKHQAEKYFALWEDYVNLSKVYTDLDSKKYSLNFPWPMSTHALVRNVDVDANESYLKVSNFLCNTNTNFQESLEGLLIGGNSNITFKIDSSAEHSTINDAYEKIGDLKDWQDEWWWEPSKTYGLLPKDCTKKQLFTLNAKMIILIDIFLKNKYMYENQ